MAFKNTLRSGQVRNVIFQEKGSFYGAALEFNIVEQGDSPQEVMLLLDNAVKGYVESAQKNKLSISVLNQEVDPEYEKLWNIGQKGTAKGSQHIYSTSSQQIAALAA
jgi:predicted RNase H-like HicB family nuclease